MRLNKYLRDAGVAARRKVDRLIQDGRVQVDGRTVREPWHEVDPRRDSVTVDGRPVRPRQRCHYLKLHKPRGVTSTLADPHARHTLSRYVPEGVRLVPVGRLDRESEGLILLTDDGDLAFRLTHPRFGVPKRYAVALNRPPADEDLSRLERGLMLADGPFRPADVRRVGQHTVELSLREGRKREIRRGFSALGLAVVRLVRLSIGPVALGDLRPGEMSPLSERELHALGVHRAPGANRGVADKPRRVERR